MKYHPNKVNHKKINVVVMFSARTVHSTHSHAVTLHRIRCRVSLSCIMKTMFSLEFIQNIYVHNICLIRLSLLHDFIRNIQFAMEKTMFKKKTLKIII